MKLFGIFLGRKRTYENEAREFLRRLFEKVDRIYRPVLEHLAQELVNIEMPAEEIRDFLVSSKTKLAFCVGLCAYECAAIRSLLDERSSKAFIEQLKCNFKSISDRDLRDTFSRFDELNIENMRRPHYSCERIIELMLIESGIKDRDFFYAALLHPLHSIRLAYTQTIFGEGIIKSMYEQGRLK